MMATLLDIWYDKWLPISVIALGTATAITSFVYMLGSALMNEKMKSWAKMELVEVFYSIIIIALVATPGLGALYVVDSVIQGSLGYGANGPSVYISGSSQPYDLCSPGTLSSRPTDLFYNIPSCHIRLGMWYLHEVFDEGSKLAYMTYIANIYTSMAADFTINFEFIFEKTGFFTITPWRGFFAMGNTIKAQMFDFAIKIMMLSKFQEIMLSFIAKALFPGLFVAGAVLRTFTFSRKLGGLLLGMAIALYYIFPMFYAFGGLVMIDMKEQVRMKIQQSPELQDVCDSMGPNACNDPPISNFMYMNGSMPMPGGSLETKDVMAQYDQRMSKTTGERMADLEGDNGFKPLEGADFSKDVKEEDRLTTMETARNKTNLWKDKVASMGKFDKGISVAYKPGGPIDALSRLAFFSVFFSLFGILATIAAIRSLSMTFGGDVEIAGLTHLI